MKTGTRLDQQPNSWRNYLMSNKKVDGEDKHVFSNFISIRPLSGSFINKIRYVLIVLLKAILSAE